jgi:hypothetical protein
VADINVSKLDGEHRTFLGGFEVDVQDLYVRLWVCQCCGLMREEGFSVEVSTWLLTISK